MYGRKRVNVGGLEGDLRTGRQFRVGDLDLRRPSMKFLQARHVRAVQCRRVFEVSPLKFPRFMLQVLPNQRDLIRLDGFGIPENNSLNATGFRHSEDVNGSRYVEGHHVMTHVVNMFLRRLRERWHGSGKNGGNCKRERKAKTVGHDEASLVTIDLGDFNPAPGWRQCLPLGSSANGRDRGRLGSPHRVHADSHDRELMAKGSMLRNGNERVA